MGNGVLKRIPLISGLLIVLGALYVLIVRNDVNGTLALLGVASGFLGLGASVDKYVFESPGSAKNRIIVISSEGNEDYHVKIESEEKKTI